MLIGFTVVIQLQLLLVLVASEITKGTGQKLLIGQIRNILYIVLFGIKSEVVRLTTARITV